MSETCRIVTLESGDQYVWLPASRRLFSNFVGFDDAPEGWKGGAPNGPSLDAVSRHWYSPVKSDLQDQPIPSEIKSLMEASDG